MDTRPTWGWSLFIGFVAIYLGLYGAARGFHNLVNFNGCNQRYGARLFDTTGPTPPGTAPIWMWHQIRHLDAAPLHQVLVQRRVVEGPDRAHP